MPIYLRQSTASQELVLGTFVDETDGFTAEAALSIANTDIKLWFTGTTTLADKNSGGATNISGGWYQCTLNATDTATAGPMMVFVHKAGARPVQVECCVLPAATYDAWIVNAAGAANGLFIAGTNAATTITSSTGSALTLSSTGSNGHALSATGNGTGNGFYLKGGATGDGLHTEGGATSGDGIDALADGSGCGLKLTGKVSGDGLCATGGNAVTSSPAGAGIRLVGGTASTTVSGVSGSGLSITGGSGAASENGAADGVVIVGGSVTTVSGGHGIKATATGPTGTPVRHGILANASGVSNAAGFCGVGSTHANGGPGMLLTGGATAGDGLKITTTNGHGVNIVPLGSGKHGIYANAGSGTGKGFEVGSLGTLFLADINQQVVDVLRVDELTNSKAAVGANPTLAQAVFAMHQFFFESTIVGTTVTTKDNAGAPFETFTINSSTAPTSITRAT